MQIIILFALNTVTWGYLLAIIAAVFWGISGSFCQYLFQQKQFNPEWLVTIRLVAAGGVLLLIAGAQKQNIWQVWKTKTDALQLIVFSTAGMAAVQYTYFAAIYASNAATATVLQYLGPAMIALYLALRYKKMPTLYEGLVIVLAIAGTFLLVTHGSVHAITISGKAFFLGMASAVTLAFYTLYPLGLLKRFPSAVVVGWGMFLGGITFCLVKDPFQVPGIWDIHSISMIAFIIFPATLFAFYAYLVSVQYIGATKASLLACVEPLSAALLAVLWLKVPFDGYDWAGTFLIVSTVVLLALEKRVSES
ncbi:MAG: EamA family transporter [Chitinophagaceae bacterium]|nr:EamA family transporter [Chitinophagaceae bacterium]